LPAIFFKREQPMQPVTLTINDACAAIGIGRTLAYELIKSGDLRTIKIGKRRLVTTQSIREFVAQLEAA
jgi:excisionase family DNA binding protein